MGRDPVEQDTDGWYFWDETWADRHGPFDSEEKAREALDHYCKTYLGYGKEEQCQDTKS